MKLVFLRFMDGRNIKSKNKIVHLLLNEITEGSLREFYLDYEFISKMLGVAGNLVDCFYDENSLNGELFLTYGQKFLAKDIIDGLLCGHSNEKIIKDLKNYDSFEGEISEICDKNNIPYYCFKNNEIQLGYGINSRIINRESYNDKSLELNNKGYIPIISVTGSNGKTSTVKLIYNIFKNLGYKCGMSSTAGIYIGDEVVRSGDTTGYLSAKEVLSRKDVEVAVLETARGGIIKNGLGYKNADVGIITSLSDDHIGMGGIKTVQDLAKIKSLVASEIKDDGLLIIKANDEISKVTEHIKNKVVFDYNFTPCIEDFISKGITAYYVEDDFIVKHRLEKKEKIINIKEIPFAFYGKSKSNVKNVICAIIAVNKIHKNLDEIIESVKEIECNLDTNYGRQNIIELNGTKFIVDYGHNEEAYLEVFDLAKKIATGNIKAIITGAGDRTDKQIIRQGEIAADYASKIIIREHEDKRGRACGETAKLLLEGVLSTGFDENNIVVFTDEMEAFDYALKIAQPDDVFVCFLQIKNVVEYALEKLKANN